MNVLQFLGYRYNNVLAMNQRKCCNSLGMLLNHNVKLDVNKIYAQFLPLNQPRFYQLLSMSWLLFPFRILHLNEPKSSQLDSNLEKLDVRSIHIFLILHFSLNLYYMVLHYHYIFLIFYSNLPECYRLWFKLTSQYSFAFIFPSPFFSGVQLASIPQYSSILLPFQFQGLLLLHNNPANTPLQEITILKFFLSWVSFAVSSHPSESFNIIHLGSNK